MVGEPGLDLLLRRDLDSVEMVALNFFALARRLGVVERDMLVLPSSDIVEMVDRGRLGVKPTGRASLLAEGVAGTDIPWSVLR